MTTKFAWLIELKFPSGAIAWFKNHNGTFGLVFDAFHANHFETAEIAQKYLDELRKTDPTGNKISKDMYVCEHGFSE